MNAIEPKRAGIQLASIAEQALAGSGDLLSAVRLIVELRHKLDNPDDEVFHHLVAIDDETDRFPLGEVRQHWSAEALVRADCEREAYMAKAEPDIRRALQAVARRFAE